jgi:hypothetical protein
MTRRLNSGRIDQTGPGPATSVAGFEVIIVGRFEVITKGEAAKVGHRRGCPFAGTTRKKFVSLMKESDDAELAALRLGKTPIRS